MAPAIGVTFFCAYGFLEGWAGNRICAFGLHKKNLMIRRSICACSAALGFVLLAGGVYTPPADKMERYTNSMVGKNLAEVVSRFGPEDHQGGSATNPNSATPQNPRDGHTWSRYGSTQHQRFVQTGTESTGKALVTVLPAGGGQG